MNFDDFRNVVFEAKIGGHSSQDSPRWLRSQQTWFQVAQVMAYLFAHMLKRLSMANLQETKVSLSAIYMYIYLARADNEYET